MLLTQFKICLKVHSIKHNLSPTCTLAPVTMLGLSYGLPSAFLLVFHFLLKAKPANIIASDEPTVPTPTAVSSSFIGAWNRFAIILTHRFCRI